MNETVFSNLEQITKNRSVLKNKPTPKDWQIMEYEIGDIKGKLIVAGEESEPENVILEPNVAGWQRIYICMMTMGFPNRANIKLSSDKSFSSVVPPKERPPIRWATYEYAQEFFWKCADMTGEKITVKKPVIYSNGGTCIVWLRFEEMTEIEIEEYKEYTGNSQNKNAHYHFDGNENTLEEFHNSTDLLTRLSRLENSDAEICSLEFSSNYGTIDTTDNTMLRIQERAFETNDKKHRDNNEECFKTKIDFLHSINVEAFAAYRMSIANFAIDSSSETQIEFATRHPEYYCKTRDDRTVNVCSYAYPEVWDFVIQGFKEMLAYGFDGISLILHRGIMINFEEPVIERFKEKYPNVDPRALPIKDDRLNGIWCEIFTEFMRKLRKDVNEFAGRHVKINAITDFDPDTAKHIGLDIKTWAKEGLIDSICQDTMELYEDVGDCMTEEGIIDIEKYKEKLKTTETVKRFHGHSIEKLTCGAEKYMKIANEYGVKFYGGIYSWPSNTETILENKRKLKEIGVENFSVFNFIHLSIHQPFYHALANICHDTINEAYCKITNYRVMSIDGTDISTYNPNWRG